MKLNIAVLPGDGIGPEVIQQGLKVLNAVAERFNHRFVYRFADVGAIAIEKTGNPLPADTLDICLESDAIFFGAIGHPKYDNDPNAPVRPEQGLLGLRKALNMYCNIRPVTIFENLLHLSPIKEEYLQNADFVIYRELIGGIYFGDKGRKNDGKTAFDTCLYNEDDIQRVAHLAFQAAQNRKNKLTLVDKANVLESSRLWREVVQKMARDEYSDVELDCLFVDNAAMQVIINPRQFDVILTSNMFGDIISDESSVLAGSLGLLPSASIGEKSSMFEPIHGSYPQGAGKDIANPIATILSAAMLLEHFQLLDEAKLVRRSVTKILKRGVGTKDLKAEFHVGCSRMGDIVEALIMDQEIKISETFGKDSSTII